MIKWRALWVFARHNRNYIDFILDFSRANGIIKTTNILQRQFTPSSFLYIDFILFKVTLDNRYCCAYNNGG